MSHNTVIQPMSHDDRDRLDRDMGELYPSPPAATIARQSSRQARQSGDKLAWLSLDSSAMIDGRSIDALRPWYERFVAVCLLVVSWLSTTATIQGNWVAPWNASIRAVGIATIIQVLVTITQWIYRRKRLSAPYLTALVVDSGMSLSGLSLVLLQPLQTIGSSFGLTGNSVDGGAWFVVCLIAIVLAWLPEHILIKKD